MAGLPTESPSPPRLTPGPPSLPPSSEASERSPRPLHEPARPSPWSFALVGLAAVAAYSAVMTWAMTWEDFDVWGGLIVGPALFAVTLPLALRLARRYGDGRLALILVAALGAKLVAALVRWYVGVEVYGGSLDAFGYLGRGEEVATQLRAGDFSSLRISPDVIGTDFYGLVAGVVIAVIGTSLFGMFLFYAWMGFLGLVAWFCAFVTAVPDGLRYRYAALLLFLPSLLYWPASVGKEAWMMLWLGLGALGAARIFARHRGGYWLLALALVMGSLVRPHIMLVLAVAVTAAFVLRRPPEGRRPLLGPVGKLAGVGVLAVASLFVLEHVEDYFNVGAADPGSLEEVLDHTQDRTATGGSRFEPARVRNPADLPWGAVTVIARPFPWEAHNNQARLSGLEGLFIAGLIVAGWRRLGSVPKLVRRSPWVAMAVVYVLIAVVAMSAFANFGILARQRVQVLPFVLALLCLPAVVSRVRGSDATTNDAGRASDKRGQEEPWTRR